MKRPWIWVLLAWTPSLWALQPQVTVLPGSDGAATLTSLQTSGHQTKEAPMTRLLQRPDLMPPQPWQSSTSTPLNLSTPVGPTPVKAATQRDLPEPATIALLGLGAAALCSCRHRWHR